MIKKLIPHFLKLSFLIFKITNILREYDSTAEDGPINKVKKHFKDATEILNFVTMTLFDKEFKIAYKACPCKEECDF